MKDEATGESGGQGEGWREVEGRGTGRSSVGHKALRRGECRWTAQLELNLPGGVTGTCTPGPVSRLFADPLYCLVLAVLPRFISRFTNCGFRSP